MERKKTAVAAKNTGHETNTETLNMIATHDGQLDGGTPEYVISRAGLAGPPAHIPDHSFQDVGGRLIVTAHPLQMALKTQSTNLTWS